MSHEPSITVHRSRTISIEVEFGFDGSADSYVSEIRVSKLPTSNLIATWTIDDSQSASGLLTLTLDDSDTSTATPDVGWMDVKRITGGEPVSLFDDPVKVLFEDMPTA